MAKVRFTRDGTLGPAQAECCARDPTTRLRQRRPYASHEMGSAACGPIVEHQSCVLEHQAADAARSCATAGALRTRSRPRPSLHTEQQSPASFSVLLTPARFRVSVFYHDSQRNPVNRCVVPRLQLRRLTQQAGCVSRQLTIRGRGHRRHWQGAEARALGLARSVSMLRLELKPTIANPPRLHCCATQHRASKTTRGGRSRDGAGQPAAFDAAQPIMV